MSYPSHIPYLNYKSMPLINFWGHPADVLCKNYVVRFSETEVPYNCLIGSIYVWIRSHKEM